MAAPNIHATAEARRRAAVWSIALAGVPVAIALAVLLDLLGLLDRHHHHQRLGVHATSDGANQTTQDEARRNGMRPATAFETCRNEMRVQGL